MAMYHFWLKSDKRPNGTKISAVKHVEYIDREGSFAHDEQWKENNKFEGDCITTAENSNALGGLNALLYKTDEFGSIRNTEHGLEVTENASLTTISIALMLADEAMGHEPLIISGSPEFRKKVLEIAVNANLPISFQDNLLQNEFEEQKEDEENERNIFVANGGKIISKRPNIKPAVAPTHAKTVKDATQEGFRLPTLSERTMVYAKSRGTDVLLQADEFNGMDFLAREYNKRVRWDFSGERKRLAKLTAQKILENVTEALEEESAVSHVEYINRERAFAHRGGCIFHAHHQYFGLKKKYEYTLAQKFKIQREIISPERAVFMAKNIFVHGAYKRLREEMRRYKKAEQRLAPKLLVYAKEEKEFQRRDWTVFPRSTFLQAQYYLTKQRTMLELEKSRLDQIKLSLQNKQTELKSLCQPHEAIRKIETIATGILRKNYKFVCQLEERTR